MKKTYLFIIALLFLQLFGLSFSSVFLQAQPLFSVKQNILSEEVVIQLKTQIENVEIAPLFLAKNNGNKEVYPVSFSSVQNTKIIILNEHTGNNVVITPVETLRATSLQLSPFFIEELRQGVLGDAERYLIVETRHATSLPDDYSVQKVSSVSAAQGDVYIPRYFYGPKENVQEALPKNRQIINIYKAKPRYISAFPNDMELQRRIAQLEEEKSYYVYMFKLPDGTLCTYDEHFNSDKRMNAHAEYGPLQFDLSGNTTGDAQIAVQHSLGLWSATLAGKVPVDIQIDLVPMNEPGVLGGSYPTAMFLHIQTNTFYPSSLWNQIVGYDATSNRDVKLEMNSKFGWYFGVDGNTPDDMYGFVSTMLHEINHGLGFSDNIDSEEETQGFFFYYDEDDNDVITEYPNIFVRQLFQGTSGPCITELTANERWNVITSHSLYSGRPGSKLLAANGGYRVKMYAPNIYESGSSVCHWDFFVSFPTFMKHAFNPGESNTIGMHEIGMLLDIGWTQEGVGIEENTKTTFSIIPNPATSLITISSESNFNSVEVINFLGQSVISQTVKEKPVSVNIEKLNSGIYFVRIATETGVSVRKFVKQ